MYSIVNRGDKFLNFRKTVKEGFFWIHNPAKLFIEVKISIKIIY